MRATAIASIAVRRLLQAIPITFAVVFLTFALVQMTPSDPARIVAGFDADDQIVAEIRHDMKLDEPLVVQFGAYLSRLLHGDMGKSLIDSRPVANEVMRALGPTLQLMFAALLWSVPVGMSLGVVAAIRRNSWIDWSAMILAIASLSLPSFAVAMLLIQIFSLKLGWFPIQGFGGSLLTLNGFWHLVLPALSLGMLMLGPVARLMRASMLETMGHDFIRTVRAKGVNERNVIWRHAIPNSLTSTITIIGLLVGVLLGSAVVIETVFSWPGLGRLAAAAIAGADLPLATGCILVLSITFILINVIVDITCRVIDPRLQLQ